MKLTNPTDNELNAAFAEKVAGFTMKRNHARKMNTWVAPDGEVWHVSRMEFNRSADAVLPFLPKTTEEGWWNCSGPSDKGLFFCEVQFGEDEAPVSREGRSWGKTPVLAMINALLKAHGVEVEFTP